jgi:hypothetical protein
MGLPLIRMDPNNYCRPRFAVMFYVLAIFSVIVTFSAAPPARKNAADSREQGDNAY